jgi:hypothetical protein
VEEILKYKGIIPDNKTLLNDILQQKSFGLVHLVMFVEECPVNISPLSLLWI